MKKKLWFTIDGRQSDKRNGIKVYQSLQYDTETGELKVVDKFLDEVQEFSISASEVSEQSTEPTEPENP